MAAEFDAPRQPGAARRESSAGPGPAAGEPAGPEREPPVPVRERVEPGRAGGGAPGPADARRLPPALANGFLGI